MDRIKRFVVIAGFGIAAMVFAGNVFPSGKNNGFGKEKELKIVPPLEASRRGIEYINKYLLRPGDSAVLAGVNESHGVYSLHIKINGRDRYPYMTKDGRLLFLSARDITVKPRMRKPVAQNIPKSDRPDVKLFVMSYCPFGLQAQRAFLPVYNLLKGKADMKVCFVDYAMHGKKEIDENLRQYCIQKVQKGKYYDYLNCFVREGDFNKCLIQARVNKIKIDRCIAETDKQYNITKDYNNKDTWQGGRFPKFSVQAGLNKKYNVRGSPTIVINDRVVSIFPRSPEKYKETVCKAFKSPPKECSENLSSKPSPAGFPHSR